jgi:hypothetical protein
LKHEQESSAMIRQLSLNLYSLVFLQITMLPPHRQVKLVLLVQLRDATVHYR